jgi:replicative DNA helicase
LSNETRSFEVVEYGVSRIVEKPLRVQLVVVDYLQIMGVRKDRSRSREQEITELADGLKALAKEERCCVVALAQLNRDVEKRPNKRPMLSDLRESGGIEQAADAILLLYRDEYYDKESKAKGLAEINVAKMRGGKTGRVVARFEPQFTRFTAIEDKDLPEALEACEFTPNEIKEGQEET